MNKHVNGLILLMIVFGLSMTSCVSKKKFNTLQSDYDAQAEKLANCEDMLNKVNMELSQKEEELAKLEAKSQSENTMRMEQITDLKSQITDLKSQRDKMLDQVGNLAVLSKEANENISETLNQLQKKDKYINMVRDLRTKTDSINLALAYNIKNSLPLGLDDTDVNVGVDKTVVFINLSDKMLYKSGSAKLNSRANEILSKIATIVKSRPGMEVMVEGYTDDIPIATDCIEDNWELSVKRATSVVKALQNDHGIDPNRLIAAGRGQYNALASNATKEGRSTNRRTRIIILPKINEFYDLLNPEMTPK